MFPSLLALELYGDAAWRLESLLPGHCRNMAHLHSRSNYRPPGHAPGPETEVSGGGIHAGYSNYLSIYEVILSATSSL